MANAHYDNRNGCSRATVARGPTDLLRVDASLGVVLVPADSDRKGRNW